MITRHERWITILFKGKMLILQVCSGGNRTAGFKAPTDISSRSFICTHSPFVLSPLRHRGLYAPSLWRHCTCSPLPFLPLKLGGYGRMSVLPAFFFGCFFLRPTTCSAFASARSFHCTRFCAVYVRQFLHQIATIHRGSWGASAPATDPIPQMDPVTLTR